MTDATEPDRDLMASAIVDGTADHEMRALAEQDPALAARVVEFRGVRSLVARTDPPTADARNRAVSAALAVWDADRADGADGAVTAAAPGAPPPAPGRSRWWLGVAAAAVTAAALGVVVANTDLGSGDDETEGEAIESAATVMTDLEEAERPAAESNAGSSAASNDLTIAGAPATDAAADAAAESAGAAESAEAAPEPGSTGTAVADLIGPDALVAFADAARTAPLDVETTCELPDLDVVGSARYAPSADVEVVAVVVGLSGDTTVVAVDASTCDVVDAVPAD